MRGAVNQGCAAVLAEWTIVLNNDVLLPAGWRNALLGAANRAGLDIVSRFLREENGVTLRTTRQFTSGMATVLRRGYAHGVCFAVRREVFMRIGGFDEAFRIGQFEDVDFFRRARG